MTNSNSADISVFEGLQANANASMGVGSTSQMSVFNDAFSTIAEIRKDLTLLREAQKKVKSSQKALMDLKRDVANNEAYVDALCDKIVDNIHKGKFVETTALYQKLTPEERESRKGKNWEAAEKASSELDRLTTTALGLGLSPS